MRVVDDVDRGLDRRLGVDARARRVAAQRKDPADLDRFFLGRGIACEHKGNRGGIKQPEHMFECHLDRLRRLPSARATEGKALKAQGVCGGAPSTASRLLPSALHARSARASWAAV